MNTVDVDMNDVAKKKIKNMRNKAKRLADRLDGYLKTGTYDYVRLKGMEVSAKALHWELSREASFAWKVQGG